MTVSVLSKKEAYLSLIEYVISPIEKAIRDNSWTNEEIQQLINCISLSISLPEAGDEVEKLLILLSLATVTSTQDTVDKKALSKAKEIVHKIVARHNNSANTPSYYFPITSI
jgi:hypothetical protein